MNKSKPSVIGALAATLIGFALLAPAQAQQAGHHGQSDPVIPSYDTQSVAQNPRGYDDKPTEKNPQDASGYDDKPNERNPQDAHGYDDKPTEKNPRNPRGYDEKPSEKNDPNAHGYEERPTHNPNAWIYHKKGSFQEENRANGEAVEDSVVPTYDDNPNSLNQAPDRDAVRYSESNKANNGESTELEATVIRGSIKD